MEIGCQAEMMAKHSLNRSANVERLPFPWPRACFWPGGAGAPSIDVTATSPTANLCPQRPLRSRQIEESYARTQSGADGQISPKWSFRLTVCNGAGGTSPMQRLLSVTNGRLLEVQYCDFPHNTYPDVCIALSCGSDAKR